MCHSLCFGACLQHERLFEAPHLEKIYLLNPKPYWWQMESQNCFYQVQAVKHVMFKACTQMFVVRAVLQLQYSYLVTYCTVSMWHMQLRY